MYNIVILLYLLYMPVFYMIYYTVLHIVDYLRELN